MEKTFTANSHIIRPLAKALTLIAHSFYQRTVLVLGGLFVVGVASLLWYQNMLQSNLVESALLRDAARYSRVITEFRTLYTEKVVEIVRPHGIEITHDTEGKDNAIPLPATFSIELGNRITEKESGSHIRLYSPYPFPWRSETGGLQDDFAQDAWNFFQLNPDTSFFRFEEFDGRPSLRFATSDLMRPSCVNCHNTHPESPKTDWKVQDVRGVLEVMIPMDTFIAEKRSGLRRTLILIGGMTLLGLVTLVVVKSRLRREEKQLRQFGSIVEQTADLVLVTDRDGVIEYINPAFTEFTGYEPEEIIGKKPNILKSGEHDQEFYEKLWEPILAGRSFMGELINKKKNGQLYIEEKTITPLKDSGGRITHFVSTAKDITGRKQADEELKKYRDHLEDLIEERTKTLAESLSETEEARDQIDGILKSVADGLVVTDLNNRVIMMNRAAEDLFGVRFSEVANRSIDFAIKDKTLRDRIKLTLQKKTTGYSFDFEWGGENDSADILSARTSVILDKHGRQTGIITIFHNVTHEREIDRMKSEFISMAAHELRTPLTSIRGFSEILLTRDNLKKSDKTKYLTYIQDQSEVLSEIISDLLDISRIEAGKGFVLQKKNCMVGDAIKQITEPYIHQLPKKSIRVHLPEKEIELFLDKEKMAQVLENLLSNAVKYSQEKVDIDITGEIKGDYYHVIMEDKGIGMTPEQLEKIYDKFYRADTSNTRITGTGLGMSIAKAIVEAHDGELWVESEFGKGTKVSFKLPLPNISGSIKGKRKEADDKIVSKDLN
ncbi:MAG: PAS domain S-box protein [Candidatus Marinimicrobia bacterium]|nr:PAS domain S-box protein [Candidatus Neomarinimicrobiota bacterium]